MEETKMARTELFSRYTPGGVFTIFDISRHVANIWFVHSGTGTDAVGHGKSPDSPFASVAYAFSSNVLTSGAGDVIYVLPGHTESIIAAGTITCDIAGVKIIGLGFGTNRPTFTVNAGATAATIVMSAANVTWENCIFVNTVDANVVVFPVTAAYCGFKNCEFQDDGADNTLHWITLSAAADDFVLEDCINKGTDTAGNTGFITIGATSHVKIVGLRSNGDFSAANIIFTAAGIDVLIADCYLENKNAVDVNIEGFAGLTGWIARNCCMVVTDGEVTWINTPGNASLYENYGVNAVGETGMIIGTVSTT
jgi:hypothetical protein